MFALCSGLCMKAFCTVGTSPAMPTFSPRTVQLVTCVRTFGLWDRTPAAASLFAHAWATASSCAFSDSAGRPAEVRAAFVAEAASQNEHGLATVVQVLGKLHAAGRA